MKLIEQLHGHLQSMQSNTAPLAGLRDAIARSQAALTLFNMSEGWTELFYRRSLGPGTRPKWLPLELVTLGRSSISETSGAAVGRVWGHSLRYPAHVRVITVPESVFDKRSLLYVPTAIGQTNCFSGEHYYGSCVTARGTPEIHLAYMNGHRISTWRMKHPELDIISGVKGAEWD